MIDTSFAERLRALNTASAALAGTTVIPRSAVVLIHDPRKTFRPPRTEYTLAGRKLKHSNG